MASALAFGGGRLSGAEACCGSLGLGPMEGKEAEMVDLGENRGGAVVPRAESSKAASWRIVREQMALSCPAPAPLFLPLD